MPIPSLSNARAKREKRCGTEATPDAVAEFVQADPAKALVMKSLNKLVASGHAEWQLRRNGDIRIRFRTGETFHLGETAITRIA